MSAAAEQQAERNYTVRTRINRAVEDVFKAIVDREIITKYFVDATSHSIVEGQEGQKVAWTWDEWGTNEVTIKKVVDNELIEIGLDSRNWEKTVDEAYEVVVHIEFEALDERTTMVSISESGWRKDAEGYRGSHDNCGGWQDMLNCLKAYLEYGVDLRK